MDPPYIGSPNKALRCSYSPASSKGLFKNTAINQESNSERRWSMWHHRMLRFVSNLIFSFSYMNYESASISYNRHCIQNMSWACSKVCRDEIESIWRMFVAIVRFWELQRRFYSCFSLLIIRRGGGDDTIRERGSAPNGIPHILNIRLDYWWKYFLDFTV